MGGGGSGRSPFRRIGVGGGGGWFERLYKSQHKSDTELESLLTCVACSLLPSDGMVGMETQLANIGCLCMIHCC